MRERERRAACPDSFTITVERPELWRVMFDNPPVTKVDPEMILELQALVEQLENDGAVKVVIFDSGIPDHFLGPYDLSCGGHAVGAGPDRHATLARPHRGPARPGCPS